MHARGGNPSDLHKFYAVTLAVPCHFWRRAENCPEIRHCRPRHPRRLIEHASCIATDVVFKWKKIGDDSVAFDEMIKADESSREPYHKYAEWYSSQDRTHLISKSRDAENIFRKTGITFAVYGHAGLLGKADPLRHHSAHHLRPRMAQARARDRAAGHRAQCLPRRHLPQAGNHPRRPRPARADRKERRLPARDDRFQAARRRLYPYCRHRHRQHRRGPVLRAGGQCAHALGRQLHAGKPRNHDADVSGAVPPEQGAARRGLSHAAAPEPRLACPSRLHRQATRRGADPRHLQFRLLRALFPCRS